MSKQGTPGERKHIV